jgi:GNAT superfamily N-acetyltransferase
MRAQEFITEGAGQKPIIIYTNNRGATIDDDIKKSLPVTQISFDQLRQWESHKSMKDPKVADWVNNKLLPELKQNGILKPLLVWNNNGEFFVIDGNHRFIAYQEAGYRGRVPVQIVPDSMITVSDTVPGQQGMAENKAAGINKMFNNLGDPVYANLQRVALLAMQGRQQEAAGRLQTVIKHADPAVQKKITDAVNSIKPVTINGRVADSSILDKSKQHNDWITNTFIPWVQSLLGQQGVAEGSENNGISFKVQKGKNKFATTLSVGGDPVGVYQYDANTGRSIAEIYPEFKGKGLGKLLVLHAIYTAANLGLDFQEDESRTSEYDNVLDSLSSNGYIVDDDGYWYVTGEGEQYLQHSLKQGVAENFADGRNPQDKGDSARHGIPKKATMAELEKASHAKGRKGQLARWQLNMRRGHKK